MPGTCGGDCLRIAEQQDPFPRSGADSARFLKGLHGRRVRRARLDRVRKAPASSDATREMIHFLDRVPVLGVGAHPCVIPSGVPFPVPAVAFG